MPDFKTTGNIYLQPEDSMFYQFNVTVCDSGKNNGYIPNGLTVSSAEVECFDSDGTNVTDYLVVGTPTVVDMVVYIRLRYSNTFGDGKYKLRIYLTLSDGQTKRARFDRVYCEDD